MKNYTLNSIFSFVIPFFNFLNNIVLFIEGIFLSINRYLDRFEGKEPTWILVFSWYIHFFFCILWIFFNPYHLSFQYTLNIKIFDVYLNFGIDGLSFFFIYLISFLLPLCLI